MQKFIYLCHSDCMPHATLPRSRRLLVHVLSIIAFGGLHRFFLLHIDRICTLEVLVFVVIVSFALLLDYLTILITFRSCTCKLLILLVTLFAHNVPAAGLSLLRHSFCCTFFVAITTKLQCCNYSTSG